MWATSDGPRVEDFGISERDLVQVPRLIVASHRKWIIVGVYLVAAASFSRSCGRRLLVGGRLFHDHRPCSGLGPVAPGPGCGSVRRRAGGERWLCRRFPVLRACLAYRRRSPSTVGGVCSRRDRSPKSEDWRAISPACRCGLRWQTMLKGSRAGRHRGRPGGRRYRLRGSSRQPACFCPLRTGVRSRRGRGRT